MPFLNLDNNYSNLAQFYNQSFVNRPSIPTKAEQFLPFDDGFIRGGITNATLASTKDVIRIGKFITGLSNISKITNIKDTTLQTATKGILFLTKQFGLQQMLNQGYDQLTSGRTDCSLISATYNLNVYVEPSGISGTTTFYTSTSITDIPADNLYYDAAQSLLLSVPGVQNVIVNPVSNEITIQSSTTNTELVGKTIILKLFIDYNIICLT